MNQMKYNLLMDTDSYKIGGHWNMYPDDLEYINSYFECRNGSMYAETVFFGLQMLIAQLQGTVVSVADVEEAQSYCKMHFGNDTAFNYDGWMYIVNELDGKLPVKIWAVAEGSVVPKSNALIQIQNTDPKCAWVVGYLETMLSRVWYPMTVATKSREIKKLIKKYWKATSALGGECAGIDFCLHDFGNRSVTSYDAGGIGGAAHLVNFKGTDTVQALRFAYLFYDADLETLAFSVPASEHSIMTINGIDGEEDVFKRLIDEYPTGILSIVDDSYDEQQFTTVFAEKYKDDILARDGKLVFRPDSGDPVEVTIRQLENLAQVFGFTVNSKNYKVLNPKVGILWGDGIDIDGIISILESMALNGWGAENIVFGMGSALTQKVNRDTLACAFKASAAKFRGDTEWRNVFKDPTGSCGSFTKKSKRGILSLVQHDEEWTTFEENELPRWAENELALVFDNGRLLNKCTFDAIRELAKV